MPYLLFVGNTSNARGGARDFVGSFETLKEARKALFLRVDGVWGWAHIAALEDGALRVVVLYQCKDLRRESEDELANGWG